MLTYNKKYIDHLVHKAVFSQCTIALPNLSEEDIKKIKLSLIKKKDIKSESDEPVKKKPKIDTSGVDILKMVLSREGESNKFKSEFKSSLEPSKEKIPSTSIQDITPMEVESTGSTEIATSSTNLVFGKIWCRDYRNMMDESSFQSYKTHFLNLKPETPINDIKNPVISVKPSPSGPKQTVNGNKPSPNEPRQTVNGNISSASGPRQTVIGNISSPSGPRQTVIGNKPSPNEPRQTVNGNISSASEPRQTVNGNKPSPSGPRQTVIGNKPLLSIPRKTLIEVQQPTMNPNLPIEENIKEIEQLYTKYFSKYIQDTIVTVANILNIISMLNKHHKERMDESFKKTTESERLNERSDANRIHDKQRQILEARLKKFFSIVITSFSDLDFDSIFRMFFLSILTVLRVLEQPKFKKGSIFKNLVLLLWVSLKNTKYENPKVFSMFRSTKFRPDCIDLISLIEDSRDCDPGITDRMALFFVSTVNSKEYFQPVIDNIISNSYKDLGLIIDNAFVQCSINSKFKDPVAVAVRNSANIIPATTNRTVQQLVIQNKPAGNVQIPVQNCSKPQTSGNTSVKSSFVSSFHETFSNSLQKKVSSESFTPKSTPSQKCAVAMQSTSNSPLVNITVPKTTTAKTTSTTGTQSTPQNKISVQSDRVRTANHTIFVGNKQYQLVKSPSSHVKVLMNGKSVLVKQPKSVKCFTKNCSNTATIMCSKCTSVKYCSTKCQLKDWYENHILHCTRLLTLKKTTP